MVSGSYLQRMMKNIHDTAFGGVFDFKLWQMKSATRIDYGFDFNVTS